MGKTKSQFGNSMLGHICHVAHLAQFSQSSNLPYLLTSTTMDWLDPHLRKLVYSSVVAVVSICGQFTTVIMATGPNTTTVVPAEPKVQWNVAETNALLDHLLSNKSEVGDGGFKPSTFTSAATALARANLLTAGPPKTNKRCRSKWNTLRGIYREIQNYRNVSGAHWDNTKGAGIKGRTALEVFNNYVTSIYLL
ncbi:hypothetical protein F4604DRAFT_1685943 [Suillus subluteus]|nr:hypothetical protein F4604DRAFT_1685943 [Suillus subluteus]